MPGARILETTFGEVPLDLIFDDQMSKAMAGLRERNNLLMPYSAPPANREFATWAFRSETEWSFNDLQRAVEHLPKGISGQ